MPVHSRKPRQTPKSVRSLFVLLALCCFGQAAICGEADSGARRVTENVLLITFDGLRWQELFSGADESFIDAEFGGVKDVDGTRERFWRSTPEERRCELLPFFWSTVAVEGRIYGDPDRDCTARVSNGRNFSYPGYNELLAGFADERIDSNAKRNNENVTVLEWLHGLERFRGRVAAFCCWDVFPFIINEQRSGIPVNAGWQPLALGGTPPELAALDAISHEIPRMWPGERYDYFTFRGALEHLCSHKPRVMYVSFGETDDWGHARRYDLYLDAARRTDDYIRRLWEAVQALPEYANRTSLVLTTDHGRGETREDWISHGEKIAGSQQIWMAVLGPDTPAGAAEKMEVTQSQVAATVAALLGEDYNAAVPQAAPPLPGVLFRD